MHNHPFEPEVERVRLALSLVLAICFHTVLGLLLIKLASLPENTLPETVYVRLTPKQADSQPSHNLASQSPPITAPSSKEAVISTTAQSWQSNAGTETTEPAISQPLDIPPLKEKTSSESKSTTPLLAKRTFNSVSNMPSPATASSGSLDVSSLFADKPVTPDATKTRISTGSKKPVTAYEKLLIEHMARSQNYDKQFNFNSLKEPRNVEMEIQLQRSGALEKANILSSSGLPTLDQAALRSAYTASPFPKPPESHSNNSFRYELSITYVPRPDE